MITNNYLVKPNTTTTNCAAKYQLNSLSEIASSFTLTQNKLNLRDLITVDQQILPSYSTPRSNTAFILEEREKRFRQSTNQLEDCRTLKSGWDSYEADPPSDKAISYAGTILDALKKVDFLPSCVCPSVEGGVGIAFVAGDVYADIECFNDGEILAALSAKYKNTTIIEINWETLDSTIDKIRKFLQSENTRSNDSREQETGSELH